MRKIYILCLLFFIVACRHHDKAVTAWISSHHFLTLRYDTGWTQLPTLDTENKTLTGVIDNRDGKSFIVQITPDIPLQRLPDNQYIEGVEKFMLRANEKNKLLLADSLVFHGYKAHRQVYLMHTDQWGLLKQTNLIIRTGTEFVFIQILFPVTAAGYEKATIPPALEKVSNDLRLR